MPKPREDEDKEDFIDRCMEEVVGDEGLDRDEAFARCNGIWDSEKEIEIEIVDEDESSE